MGERVDLAFVISVVLAACNAPSTPEGADAAIPADAGGQDAGIDAGIEVDAGTPDAGPPTVFVEALDDGQAGTGTEEDPFRDLQAAIDAAPDGATVRIRPGTYSASPVPDSEDYCGNCQEHRTGVEFTRGFYVTGKSLSFEGESDARVVRLDTGAGYGFLVEDAGEISLFGLTITGGQRDEDGAATSAAVVVRNSTVSMENIRITRNQDLREGGEYPGVAGVAGREGAVIRMRGSKILHNSWDGFVLYRGARGVIVDTEVDDGNGVGIAATWNGELTAINNRVSGYWKGLGCFGSSHVVAHNNVVFSNLTWGVWAAGDEASRFEIVNNTIARQGNCNMALNAAAPAIVRNNILAFGGQSAPQICPNVGIWIFTENGPQDVAYNLIFGHPLAEVWLGGTQPAGDTGFDVSDSFIGVDHNLSADPLFEDDGYVLGAGSPGIDAGDPSITDRDGSRSDLGHLGGPQAGMTSFP